MIKAEAIDMKSRRFVMQLGAGVIGAVLTGAAAKADIVPALSKSAVGYRDVPNNGKVCAQCVYFIYKPASGATPQSRCELVAGPINPAGWCEVWATKA